MIIEFELLFLILIQVIVALLKMDILFSFHQIKFFRFQK